MLFYFYFTIKGAIGALDGTLVHAIVPASHQTAYRGRGGGRCYQNVLGICDFNMMFTFVWAGWEGIAHDSRVLNEVAFNPRSGFFFHRKVYIICNYFRKYYFDTMFSCLRTNCR